MGRNSVTEAIVLRSSRFAEYHKRLALLTLDGGIIEALAYGAFKSKSKLAGITGNFVHLKAYLYYEPVKKQHKLIDAELISSNDGMGENLRRFYTASVISELISVTYAGGDEHLKLFPLVGKAFALLSTADDHHAGLVLIQFLARFYDAIGYPPHWEACELCGTAFSKEAERFVSVGGIVRCRGCGNSEDTPISAGGFAYLSHSTQLDLYQAMRIGADRVTLDGVKRGLIRIAERVSDAPLRSLRGAEPFL